MTLKQAFTLWSNDPKNIKFASASRQNIQNVFIKKYGHLELNLFYSKGYVKEILNKSTELKEFKIKATSALLDIINWCNTKFNYSEVKPNFDYNLVDEDISVGNHEPEKPKRGKPARKVVQINPTNLKPEKVWDSIKEVQNEMGILNIARAINNHTRAGDWYWCYYGDEEKFEPKGKPFVGGDEPAPAKTLEINELKGKLEAANDLIARLEDEKSKLEYIRKITNLDPVLLGDLKRLGIMDHKNEGHLIPIWSIWQDYKLNPWDAEIVMNLLNSSTPNYEEIIRLCNERIRQNKFNQ